MKTFSLTKHLGFRNSETFDLYSTFTWLLKYYKNNNCSEQEDIRIILKY